MEKDNEFLQKTLELWPYAAILIILVMIVSLIVIRNTVEKMDSPKRIFAFYSMPTCGHCIAFKKSGILEKLKKEYSNKYTFVEYSTGNESDLKMIRKNKITRFPSFQILNNFAVPVTFSGDRTYAGLKKFLDSN